MLKTKKITVANQEFTVRELKVKEVREMTKKIYEGLESIDETVSLLTSNFTDIPAATIDECSLSEVEEIIKAIKDVNASFLGIPKALGVEDVAKNLLKKVKNDYLQKLLLQEESQTFKEA